MGRIQDQQRHVQQVSDLHLATIEALALAIDAKDQTAQSHIRRVQVYAAGLARALGMPENEIQGVKTAALLHDIGKLAVPEHILSKPGPLTQEEFQKIRIHPQVGAEIISGVPFPYPVAPLILSHHERWDGKGYPIGPQGRRDPARRAHPLGGRLLRRADVGAAVSQGDEPRGRDGPAAPGKRQGARSARRPDLHRAVPGARRRGRGEPGAGAQADARADARADRGSRRLAWWTKLRHRSRTNVFQDIALAHREIYALYEIAQAMGSSLGVSDTMALISSKLSNIVPFSCCALFLYNDETETLRCRFATGVESDIIQQLTIRNGQGLTGWVARNRRPLVNARPSADFEAAGVAVGSDVAAVGAGLPAGLQRAVHRHDLRLPHRARGLHRRSSPAARSHLRAGRGGHLQLDRLRADAGRFAHRPADRAAEHALHVHAPDARAGARRAAEVGGLAAGHGPRQLQGHQRHLRPPRRRSGAARGGRRAARRHPAVRHLRPLRRRRVHRRAVGMRRRGGRAQAAGAAARGRQRCRSSRGPGKMLPLAISVGAAIFPHDGDSYETLLATADSRMYRDKTRRKRESGAAEHPRSAPPPVSESDLVRAAIGVL